jgi:hypothetical protein
VTFIRPTTTPGGVPAAPGGIADAAGRARPLPVRDRAAHDFDPARPPRVSIGLPVYNGARYLRAAIESILAQTFTDFELIICDNASTDQTQSICTAFAARDPRVRYHRNPENIGAAGNFNLAFKLSRGEFFKWAAHDDLHEPNYLARCVALLDADPSAVLSHTGTRVIDDAGVEVPVLPGNRPPQRRGHPELYEEDLYDPPRGLEGAEPADRLRGLLCGTKWCFEIFGLMRSSALRATPLHLSFYGSDKVLLAAMAIRGRFRAAPEPMFLRRFHPGQSSSKDAKAQALWMNTRGGRAQYVPPQLRCLQWYVRLVARSGLPLRDRLRCLGATGHWVVWLGRLIVQQRNERGFLHRLVSQFRVG